jgi:hypothetical protein
MDENRDNGDNKPFIDDHLPQNYVPFYVQAIGNDIVVTFALYEEGQQLESDGPGLGYVDIFSSDGQLVQRLEHGDWLNAPWGVALAPLDFGVFSHDLLVGQFAGGGTSSGMNTQVFPSTHPKHSVTQSLIFRAETLLASGFHLDIPRNDAGGLTLPIAFEGETGIERTASSSANSGDDEAVMISNEI